jgi:hypothetical protein
MSGQLSRVRRISPCHVSVTRRPESASLPRRRSGFVEMDVLADPERLRQIDLTILD